MESPGAEFEQRFRDGPVPQPPFWSRCRIVPHALEFWVAKPIRMHERTLDARTKEGGGRQSACIHKGGGAG